MAIYQTVKEIDLNWWTVDLLVSWSFFKAMAWRSHGTSHQELVDKLKQNDIIKDSRVYDALINVDRGIFAKSNPYMDSPQGIGYNVTISAPHMHAHALEILKDNLNEGDSALDVGSGTGYLTACMASMVGETGIAVGIDHIPELVESSKVNINNCNPELIRSGRLKIVFGDGRQGYAPDGPYDAIHVGAAPDVVPKALLDQLKPGGRLLIPVGPQGGNQTLDRYDKPKDGGEPKRTKLMGVRYGPLTSTEKQLRRF
ncbi:protein-L-isoaspartate(D-aspartate) O-methyltransferase-like [Glandiceps talaboti]